MKREIFSSLLAVGFICMSGNIAHSASRSEGCIVTFAIEAIEPINVLQFDVDYSAIAGSFYGSGARVDCSSAVRGASLTANDRCEGTADECGVGPDRSLVVSLFQPKGLPVAGAVARCRLDVAAGPKIDPDQFNCEVMDASGEGGLAPSRRPTVKVSSVLCPAASPEMPR